MRSAAPPRGRGGPTARLRDVPGGFRSRQSCGRGGPPAGGGRGGAVGGVAVIVFVLLRVIPGDPVAMMIGPGATAADIAALKAHYGLDAPMLTQFWIWIQGAITGDFGTSITLHLYVTDVLASRLPATIELATLALVVAV